MNLLSKSRRLIIENFRLSEIDLNNDLFPLNKLESHYLSNVIRLQFGDKVSIIDGLGHLWETTFIDSKYLRFKSSYLSPTIEKKRLKPLICLAVALPKKDFDILIRMTCEIGVDIIQPIISERVIIKQASKQKYIRWNLILNEAIEQSERLWKPELRPAINFKELIDSSKPNSIYSIAKARVKDPKEVQSWLTNLSSGFDEIWIVIGPEGGWTAEEESLAYDSNFTAVSLGDSILRTSTAAIASCNSMISWRRQQLNIISHSYN